MESYFGNIFYGVRDIVGWILNTYQNWLIYKTFFANLVAASLKFFSEHKDLLILTIGIFSFWGFNFILWGSIGLVRYIQEQISSLVKIIFAPVQPAEGKGKNKLSIDDVAAIVPAHNEELVIAKTISSLLPLLPPRNIFIVSDGSTDKTAPIARDFKVNVLEQSPGRGKAGALESGIKHFGLNTRFKAVIFVDADTVLPADYLEKALPYFNDDEVVAIAGYARTIWAPAKQSFRQKYYLVHREIVYTLSQVLLKFGQSWKYMNVATIVPGFASIYRASVLDKINLNPPGLVIEDFNMTFEVHHKKLGRIVHVPSVSGYTQDPDNFHDYFRQVKRWDLGFWQTVKFHGLWPSLFSAALFFFIAEVLLASLTLICLPILLFFMFELSFVPELNGQAVTLMNLLLKIILYGIWLPNMMLCIVVGIYQKRPQYYYYAPLVIFLKFVDAYAFIEALFKAFLVRSTGRWVSPSRRAN